MLLKAYLKICIKIRRILRKQDQSPELNKLKEYYLKRVYPVQEIEDVL